MFVFYVQCILAKKLFLDDDNILTRSVDNKQLLLQPKPQGSAESICKEGNKRIMLVTMSVINRLSIKMTMKQFRLSSQLTIVISIEDAIEQVSELWNEKGDQDGFAIVLLDLEESMKSSERKIIKAFVKGLAEHQIPYRPKMVKLTGLQNGRFLSKS